MIANRFFSHTTLFLGCLLLALSAVSCNKSGPVSNGSSAQASGKRYQLKGKVVSIDKQAGSASVDAEAIPGFMDAMTMPYPVQPASALDQLSAGDAITADVVVDGDKYWLENVKVTQHATAPPAKPTAALHIPAVNEAVPDFKLINQNGRQISLNRYRGKALLVTFIYTRCPFPDFCPRVSGEFAQINRELHSNTKLFRQTHLLSISIDPKHDTPAVLRQYGYDCSGIKQPVLFNHWEFAAPSAAQLPRIANFFGLTVAEEGGLITHSLSTAVIGPDGRIFKWYPGNDWQPSDLIRDAASAMHPTV